MPASVLEYEKTEKAGKTDKEKKAVVNTNFKQWLTWFWL